MRLYKLLVVDDEFETRDAICRYFPWNELGFEIVGQCDDGKQALDYIRDNPVDVVFSDIRMPIMTGIEMAEVLFNAGSKIKVVFLSGYADFEFARQAIIFGVKDYILKPAHSAELTKVFARIKSNLDMSKSDHSSMQASEARPYKYDEEIIAAIKKYVEAHYREASLKEASDLVNMNPSYLSHFFKQKTGENFSQYINSVRMQKASELLKDPRNKIYDVSDHVGYSNAKNFTKAFKQYFEKTPMAYRRGMDNEPNEQ